MTRLNDEAAFWLQKAHGRIAMMKDDSQEQDLAQVMYYLAIAIIEGGK